MIEDQKLESGIVHETGAWRTANATYEYAIAGLIGLAGALLLATAGGWALGLRALWTFSFMMFIPWPLRLALAALLLAATLIPFLRFYSAFRRALWARHSVFRVPPWLAPLLAGLLFWLLRERTYHGDALLKLELLRERTIQTDPYVWKEPLDSVLVYSATALLRMWGQPPETAIALLSVLAGMAYMAAVLYGAAVLAVDNGQRTRYLVGLLALGSAQLWFGHVENYSLVTACAFAVTALAIGYLHERNRLWPVGLAAGFAVSFHPQAAFTLPALLLLLERRDWLRQGLVLAGAGLAGPLLTLLSLRALDVPWPAVNGGFAGDDQLFLSPAQALAPAQLWDALNNLWLIAPLAPLWLVFGGWALSQRTLWQARTFRYLTVLAMGLLFYHFTFQNDLPRPRDWDLFAIVAPGLTLWGLWAWEAWLAVRRKDPPRSSHAMMWPALTFAVLFVLSWVGINSSLTLVRPRSDEREIYARYRLLDLTTLLPQAVVTPPDPICAEPVGCERVTLTHFTMPQDGDTRPVIFAHAPARIVLPLAVPNERAFLWLSPALDPEAWGWGGDGVTFKVAVARDGQETTLYTRHLNPAETYDLGWQEALIPLDAYRGERIDLILSTHPGPANNDAADRAGWGLLWLLRGTPDVRGES
ncbi:MAG: hypothetical protein DCC55_22850 [Chloroflexi bacterium]|nr:MAG: hypothetical protein DCC55_22850 [Chloroflexota bacterium]